MNYYYLYPAIKKIDIGRIYKEKRIAPFITSRNIKSTAYIPLGEYKTLQEAISNAVMRGLITYDIENEQYLFTIQGVGEFI